MRSLLLLSLVLALSLAVSGQGVPGRIVGGTDAEEGQYPYQVSIQTRKRHFCGGSILNERYILTAAHCVVGAQAKSISVVVGITSLSEGGERYQAEKLIPHEDFDYSTISNDIALIRLEEDIIYNEKVLPINASTTDKDYNEYPAVLSGWGTTRLGGSIPDRLQQIDLKLISHQKCQKLQNLLPVAKTNICTLTQEGEGACHGDSGGPLVADGVQVGVVSWGKPCAKGAPDVFTRVSSYKDWIEDQMTE